MVFIWNLYRHASFNKPGIECIMVTLRHVCVIIVAMENQEVCNITSVCLDSVPSIWCANYILSALYYIVICSPSGPIIFFLITS